MIFFITTHDSVEFSEELIFRVARNDMSALKEIYQATSTKLFAYAMSIMKDRVEAEDVLQNAYLKVIANADKYKPWGKPMAWMCTIVKNEAFSRIRGEDKTIALEDERTADTFSEIESSLDKMVLKAALQALSDSERQIVMLHSVSGLKYREIAEVMEVPLATAISKNTRALRKLRKYIEGKEMAVK